MLDYTELEKIIDKFREELTLANRTSKEELENFLTKHNIVLKNDNESYSYCDMKNAQILIVGQLNIKIKDINGICKNLGIEPDRLVYVSYDEATNYPYDNLRFSNRYSDVIFGATLQNNGYIIEQDSEKIVSNYPNIIIPEISSSSNITSEIYTDGYILIPYAGRVTFKSDEELEGLNVSTEVIANSSSNSLFVTDLNSNIYTAAQTAEEGEHTIAALATKTITEETEDAEAVTSEMLIIANTVFASDYSVEGVSSSYPISYIANNKDFMLDSIASLTSREDVVKIRKDMSTSTYAPTQKENTIVLATIFAVPVIIILAGIFVGIYRKRKR